MVAKIRWKTISSVLLLAFMLMGCGRELPDTVTPARGTVMSEDGVALRYDVAGGGETALVFVHCWTCNRTFWDAQFQYFANEYKVVRLDLAGHGESGHGRKGYTMSAFGGDVAAVVDALGLKQVVLIGHSMGGPVSVEAAKRLGDRVIGVVGVDTFYTGFPYPQGEAIAEFVQPFKEDFKGTASQMVRSMFAPGTDEALIRRVEDVVLSADQPMAISAMTDIFLWTESEVPASLNALGSRLRNINADPKGEHKPLHNSVVLVEGVGHFVAQEKPEAFNRELTNILSDYRGS